MSYILHTEDPTVRNKDSLFVDPVSIGILVVLALMFLVICMVLQLFSRSEILNLTPRSTLCWWLSEEQVMVRFLQIFCTHCSSQFCGFHLKILWIMHVNSSFIIAFLSSSVSELNFQTTGLFSTLLMQGWWMHLYWKVRKIIWLGNC